MDRTQHATTDKPETLLERAVRKCIERMEDEEVEGHKETEVAMVERRPENLTQAGRLS